MASTPTPKMNPVILNIALQFRFLRNLESKGPLGSRKLELKFFYFWFMEYLGNVLFGWTAANLVADYGWTVAVRTVEVKHEDWALQTRDLTANVTILFVIFVAQLFVFSLRQLSDNDLKGTLARGTFFWVLPITLLVGICGLIFRLNQIPFVELKLYLPNPLAFSIVWISLSSIFFMGYIRLWKYILLGVLRGKKN